MAPPATGSGSIVGNGRAKNGDIRGSSSGSLKRSRSICQNQIHILGQEAVDDGGAVGGVAGSVLLIKLYLIAQLLGEGMGVDEYFEEQERSLYQVKCPQCGDQFAVDEQSLVKGFQCPTCGEHLIQAE